MMWDHLNVTMSQVTLSHFLSGVAMVVSEKFCTFAAVKII